jgi:NAD(P)H-hydrate epimerase
MTLALDVPTGIDSDTGESLGRHPEPFLTLCVGLPKRYLFTGEGRKYADNWKLVTIGIPEEVWDGGTVSLVGHEIESLIPMRGATSHKRTSIVLSICGSRQYPGAAALVACAAMRMGAGMVVAAGPAEGLDAVKSRVIEAPISILPSADGELAGEAAVRAVQPWLEQAGAVVLGPGIGRSDGAGEAVVALLKNEGDLQWVLDGDALFHIAERDLRISRGTAVLTPHAGEAARLLCTSSESVDADRFSTASELAKKYNQVVVLKGLHSIVADPSGSVDVIATGTPLLATAGTGDVLSGMIGSLLAQKLSPRNAAIVGASIHGYLAEVNAVRMGPNTYGILASELAEEIPMIVTLLRGGELYPKCLDDLAPDAVQRERDEEDN